MVGVEVSSTGRVAILLYLALWYWVSCGDVTLVDGLILAELTAPAIGYWLISELLVLAERWRAWRLHRPCRC